MPLYEYECHKCGQVFEVMQKFSDAPLKIHTGCGGGVERLLSAPAFHFKGSGWYITDYAKKNGSSAASTKSDSAASNHDETKTETKSESKPAATAESAPKS
ncbi:MAG: FmdB family zinc ribbon protein [Acidobacteriota bacterium]